MQPADTPRKACQTAPRRVCMIVPSYWQPVMGGAQYQAKVLLERMHELGGYDLHYLARRLPDDLQPTTHGLHRIGRSEGMYFLRDTPTLLSTLKKLQPDTIYCHVGCAYVGIAAWYCRSHQAKLVWHLASDIDAERWARGQRQNTPMSWVDKKVMDFGLRHTDAVIAQTDHQANLLASNYGITAAAVIQNFHPEPTEPLKKSDTPEVLWVANLKAVKQPMQFVELARALKTSNVQFTMLGGMQLAPEAKQDFESALEATENLRWLGSVTQDEVNARLASAHLLVNTSSYEGFSNTFIQAWQREVPVCSLNVDPDSLLTKGQLGHFSGGSIESLVESVNSLTNDADKRQAMGQRARNYANTHHGMAAADRLIELLN